MKKVLGVFIAAFVATAGLAQCPTITLGPNPSLCHAGYTTLTFTATTGNPNLYRIDWDAAANAAGLADYTEFAPLGSAPHYIQFFDIPGPGSYLGQVIVKNGPSGCESAGTPFTVTAHPFPSITPTNPSPVCSGTPSVTIGLAPENGADQFMLDWLPSANAAGLVDVPWTSVSASPLTFSTSLLPVGNYGGVIYSRNSVNGCESSGGATTGISSYAGNLLGSGCSPPATFFYCSNRVDQ
jgi:hypothetical protein